MPARFDRSDLIAVIALAISVLGAAAALWQNNLIDAQRRGSLWPSVNASHKFKYDTLLQHYTYALSLVNDGVGPAIIGDLEFSYRGKSFSTGDLAELVAGGDGGYSQGHVLNMKQTVLQAGQVVQVLEIAVDQDSIANMGLLIDRIVDHLHVSTCYCSVYADCWTYHTTDDWPLPVDDCPGMPPGW